MSWTVTDTKTKMAAADTQSSDSARAKSSSRRASKRPSPKDEGGKSSNDRLSSVPESRPIYPIIQCAISPLFEVSGSKPLQLRVDFDLNSAKAGELPSGKAVHAIESRQTADGAVRMAVTPEGSAIILGWLTGVTKDGKKQLHELGHPVLQVIAAKPLAARDAFDLTSGKAGELAVNAFVHAFEARATADGAWRIGYAPEGASTIKAWVTAVTKDGTENLALLVGRRAGSSNGAGASASAQSTTGGPSTMNYNDVPPAAARLILASRPLGLIVATKPALVRKAFELTSDKAGELGPNATCAVVEERENSDGSRRVCVALDNQLAPYGWITSITATGAINLKTTGRPTMALSRLRRARRAAGVVLLGALHTERRRAAGTLARSVRSGRRPRYCSLSSTRRPRCSSVRYLDLSCSEATRATAWLVRPTRPRASSRVRIWLRRRPHGWPRP